MNQDDINRMSMVNTVDSLMDQNESTWSSLPAIQETVTDVKSGITEVNKLAGKQATATAGTGDEKANVRLAFEAKILEIADQLSALAAKKGDAILGAQVELTPSALDKMDVDALEELGKTVSGLAVTNIVELEKYGITKDDVTALDELTKQFNKVKNAPRVAISGRKGVTDTLPVLVAKLMSILRNRLDKQMTKFKQANAEFYAAYRSARVIVDRGGGQGSDGSSPTAPPTTPK
ncbi:MAG: hypothetical protein EPO07_09435 [Verrucomicrobia bacterium]|nr:MAG: hypothetical protein EPO07_09435 [Verrucomicrobiota bacterium]